MKRQYSRGIRNRFITAVLLAAALIVLAGAFPAFAGTVPALPDDPKAAMYNEFADLILRRITDDSMGDYEKCCAVYDYVHSIPYINIVYAEDNWRENGYEMLMQRGGDCFGYYSASRLLLERLGYQVIEMQNNNGFTHFWCLVSTDGGLTWRHFDPTCWSWGSDGYLCMVTDDELAWYAQCHPIDAWTVTHDWDRMQTVLQIEATWNN